MNELNRFWDAYKGRAFATPYSTIQWLLTIAGAATFKLNDNEFKAVVKEADDANGVMALN